MREARPKGCAGGKRQPEPRSAERAGWKRETPEPGVLATKTASMGPPTRVVTQGGHAAPTVTCDRMVTYNGGVVDSTWRAVADPTRRRLIELLRDGPRTTGELCQGFAMSRFAVMKHLRVLERGGLIAVRREGRKRWNSLNMEMLHQMSGRWAGSPEAAAVESRGAPMGQDDRPPGVPPATAQLFVDAVPWKVFDALTVGIAAWWGPPHLRSADATNLVLEPQPGGRFYEEWGHRQGALRAIVTAIRQDERLELSGPIFQGPGDNRLVFRLEPREGGTLVTVSAERVPGEVLDDLFRVRLKAFVEKGTRTGLVT